MFKPTLITTAVASALLFSSQQAIAQENQATEDKDVEVIQVSGIRGSLNQALNNKRFSTQIVDSIVAEDIGKFPDNNVVEALQRVTGVQVTGRGGGEASTVSIRGLNDVHTTVNGRDVFTGTGRAVALQDIPASLLSNVTVYKTRSASQTERGIAGSINIDTHRPFDFKGDKVVLAARGIYADQSKELDPNVSALYSTRWDTDLGEMGALFNISFVETNYRDDDLVAGAAFPFYTANPHSGGEPYRIISSSTELWKTGLTKGLNSAAGSTLTLPSGEEFEYLLARDAVFGRVYEAKRQRPAANVSFQWAVNDELEILSELFYTGYRSDQQTSMWFTNTYEQAEGNNGNLLIDTPLLFEGTNIIKERQVYAPLGFQSGDAMTGKTDSYLFALGAKWMPTLDITINTELLYQSSKYETEFFAMRFDRAAYGLDIDFNDQDGVPALSFWDNPETTDVDESDMADIGNWNTGTLYDNGGTNEGDALTLTLDGQWDIDSFIEQINFGVKAEKRTAVTFGREKNATNVMPVADMIDALAAAGATGDGSGFVNTVEDYMFGRADIFSSYVSANGLYMLENDEIVRSIYGYEGLDYIKTNDIDETSYAAYLTGKYRFGDLSGELGVRYVNYEQDLYSQNFQLQDQSAKASQSDFLTSFNLNWDITEDLVGRVAYTETLRMPEYTALSGIQFWQDVLTTSAEYGTGNGGNPNLDPVTSKNYDLSLEWYFAPGSSLYGAMFKRELTGQIVAGYEIVQRYSERRDKEIGFILSSPVNATEGELSGVEIGLTYVPENLPKAIDGVGFQASYTSLDSWQQVIDFDASTGEVSAIIDSKMPGVSDSSYSLVAFYENDYMDTRLSYTWREKFYTGNEALLFANPIQFWSRPEQSLDFQFSYDVTDNLVVTFDATNILDDKYQNYYGEGNSNSFNFGTAIYSRTFALGMRYSFE